MKKIGGYFPLEPCDPQENHFWDSLLPQGADLRFMMSGRCGNYYALQDICLTDKRKVAYVPVYTCETVLAPFEKAGFQMMFYDVAEDGLTPVFDPAVLDQISLISICGYYGFISYDRDFIRQCHERGIIVLEDTTHSILSKDGIDPYCDYVVGSLRKWIGVPAGGFAMKMHGTFTLPVLEPDMEHLNMRIHSMKIKQQILDHPNPDGEASLEAASAQFWNAEMMLRKIFDAFSSDDTSVYIMKHFPVLEIIRKRRENYHFLASHFPKHPQFTVVYPKLPEETVPSHFTVYVKDRDPVQNYLKEHGISTTAYWPQSRYVDGQCRANASYIYQHVLSIPCDQRYDICDMSYICDTIAAMPE